MIEALLAAQYDVCVIGAGPAGLTAALELAERGFKVALVESGTNSAGGNAQRLSDAEITTPATHGAMRDAVRRGLGGTSAIWGGRCVPMDPIDYEARPFVAATPWPFGAKEVESHYARACQLLGIGKPNFSTQASAANATKDKPLSGSFLDDDALCATTLERWTGEVNAWNQLHADVEQADRIALLPDMTCVGFLHTAQDFKVVAALVNRTHGGQDLPFRLTARAFVIACGGVESTRLVLNSMSAADGLKLEAPHLVGRYYMGHPSGKIADIQLTGNPHDTIYGFEVDGGVYVRRRITFRPAIMHTNALLNIAFWLDNPPISDWRHGSGVLSAAYLALAMPVLGGALAPAAIRQRAIGNKESSWLRHCWNCIRAPFKTLNFCVQFCYKRYVATPRLPGFFTFSATNRYALHYHAEQAPNWDSTVTLSESRDALGMQRARIALRWSQQDIESIIKAHRLLDDALRAKGIGQLVYRYKPELLEGAIRDQAVDGFHQIGTLRMANDSTSGVTNAFGRLFGTSNCFVASSATFPTAGQANPTLTMVALTVRQAIHIAELLRPKASSDA